MAKTTPKVLKFDPVLAQAVGLNEAIVISQVDHYLKLASKNDKFKTDDNGTKWTYNSLREWEIQFPFWSKDTIGRIFRKLESEGYIYSRSRARRGERKWSFEYTLNYEKLASLPEVKCCSIDTKTKNEPNVALLIQRDNQMLQICDKEPENTKISNTKISFPHKKDKVEPYGEKENYSPDLTPSLACLTVLKEAYPNIDETLILSYWKQQAGYYVGKLKSEEELKGKVVSLIEQESRKVTRAVGVYFQDPAMNQFPRGLRVGVQE